jgi:hypothetical protein
MNPSRVREIDAVHALGQVGVCDCFGSRHCDRPDSAADAPRPAFGIAQIQASSATRLWAMSRCRTKCRLRTLPCRRTLFKGRQSNPEDPRLVLSSDPPRAVHRCAGPPARGESRQRLLPQRADRGEQAFRRLAAVRSRSVMLRHPGLAGGSHRPADEPGIRGARRGRCSIRHRGITAARIYAAARPARWGRKRRAIAENEPAWPG